MILDLFGTAGTPGIWPECFLTPEATAVSMDNVQLLISGDMTPEAYGQAMQDVVNK